MSGAAACANAPANRMRGFKPLDVGTLRCMDAACVDLYLARQDAAEPMLYCRAGQHWQAERLLDLTEAGIRHVLVSERDFGNVGAMLLETIPSFLHRESIPAAERFSMLQMAVSLEIERAFRHFDCAKIVDLANDVGRQFTALLSRHNVLPHDLFRVARHDFTTFTHVTNVACYAVVLAKRMGFRNPAQLDRIAVGAILHDVGKRFIPAEILNKRGRLDPAERDLIESHPQRGYEELVGRPGIDSEQLLMVYQHHERLDGTGYPVRILGDEIHPWAQAIAVVDVFEAMTGRRPYRRPASAADVLGYLERQAGTHFNREIVSCWTSAMREK